MRALQFVDTFRTYATTPNTCDMLFEKSTKWADDGSSVEIICLDFRKAFDKVPHLRLVLKIALDGKQ